MRIKPFRFAGDDVAADIREKYGYEGDLAAIYAGNTGPIVHKWHHYIPLYDRYFGTYRNRPVRFLEIGVSQGGSLQIWRKFFGPDATIFGIDINPDCARFDGQAAQVRIGSQADEDFLKSVVGEMGGLDLVLDDGSHEMEHIRTSLRVLFPLLSYGGTYIIEDLHTAYSKKYGGGVRGRGNFFNDVLALTHDMHRWYHPAGVRHEGVADDLAGIHIHDSIVVLDKARVYPPTHSRVGR